MPPLPTAENWRGSPTSTTRHRCRSARSASCGEVGGGDGSGLVDDHAWPRRGGRSRGRVGRSGCGARCSSLSRVSAATPVSAARTSAAAAVGATPNTTRPVVPEMRRPRGRGRWSSRSRRRRRRAPGVGRTATAADACGLSRVQFAPQRRRQRTWLVVGSEAPLGPLQDPLLLVEDGRGGERPVGGGLR